MKPTLSIRAHAKINLSLRVLGRRADGYHQLRTVFQSVALCDTLTLAPSDGRFELHCSDENVPLDSRNLVWKAGALLWNSLGRPGDPHGVAVRIRKRIPPQAGLAGGSSDGAAALVALARMWSVALGQPELVRLAAALGADVPYFLVGGTALGLGRGDEVSPLADRPRSWVVLVLPAFGVSTAEAFAWYDADKSAHRSPEPGEDDLANDLEAPVARRHPEVSELVRALGGLGAERASMSGSGSTVFGLFGGRARADLAAAALTRRGFRVLLTRTLTRAEYWRRSSLGTPRTSALSPGGPLV